MILSILDYKTQKVHQFEICPLDKITISETKDDYEFKATTRELTPFV